MLWLEEVFMIYIWFVCLLIGLLLPLLSIVLDFFDGLLEFEFDISFDIDFDFFPTSIKSICMGLFLYGSTALIIHYMKGSDILSNVIGGIIGYIGAVVFQNIMRYLKHNESYANNKSIVLFSEGIVINKIAENGYGIVRIDIQGDSIQTYTAREKDNKEVEQGTKVKVINIEESGVLVVE